MPCLSFLEGYVKPTTCWHKTKSFSSSNKTTRPNPTTYTHSEINISNLNNEYDNNLAYTLKERNPYDVHVYYKNTTEEKAAMELRQKMQQTFGNWMRFYTPKHKPIGPHPYPMWEADFHKYEYRYQWNIVKEFLLEHNVHDLSILIHPHSVDGDYADHTTHAFWIGESLELRISGWTR